MFVNGAHAQPSASGQDFDLNKIIYESAPGAVWGTQPEYPLVISSAYYDWWSGHTKTKTGKKYVTLGFGDDYPFLSPNNEIIKYSRPSGATLQNFLYLIAPGNMNSGNWWPQWDYRYTDMTSPMERYASQQFKYILLDMDSRATRTGEDRKIVSFLDSTYYAQAESIQKLNPNSVVLIYCSPPIAATEPILFPWLGRDYQRYFLRSNSGNFSERSTTFDWQEYDKHFYVMDMTDAAYQSSVISYVVSVIQKYKFIKGILLDNMTYYPMVPQARFQEMLSRLGTDGFRSANVAFIDSLKYRFTLLHRDIKIICNNLGMVENIHGPDHGIDIVVGSHADGGMYESFYNTVWPENRVGVWEIMKNILDHGKTFLTVSNYRRGADSLVNEAFQLGRRSTNGQYPVQYNTVVGQETPCWNPPYFRMQQSYLAIFFLGIPTGFPLHGMNNSVACYSYTGGETNYRNIPFYKIWNEPFGTPEHISTLEPAAIPELDVAAEQLGLSIRNTDGEAFERNLGNHKIVLNKSYSNPLTIELTAGYDLCNLDNGTPGGPYIYGSHYGRITINNISRTFLTLNPNEGVVLKKYSQSPSIR
jgi:hypothetical protein